jgi:hypothetical protein
MAKSSEVVGYSVREATEHRITIGGNASVAADLALADATEVANKTGQPTPVYEIGTENQVGVAYPEAQSRTHGAWPSNITQERFNEIFGKTDKKDLPA